MKRILLPLLISSTVILFSCSSKKEADAREMILLTEPQHNSSLATDTASSTAKPQTATAQVDAPVQKMNTPRRRKQASAPIVKNDAPLVAPAPMPAPAPEPQPATEPSPTATETAGTGNTETKEAEPAATPAKKKGISNKAKGAIIGGVGGAVVGAVIGKNAKGAVIGGVVGAAGGYILGKKKDKKQEDNSDN